MNMMKKLLIAMCAVALASSSAFAGIAAGTGIVGSKHDMNVYIGAKGGTADQYGRVCAYCHTPHHAVEDLSADYMPLWSRTVTAESTWLEYDSATLDAAIIDPLMGPSRLCMSCHDGAVAVDAYYGNTATTVALDGDAFGQIGVGLNGDLSNDHPIGFDYEDVAGTDTEINASSTVFGGGTATIASVLYDDGLGGAIMTCATCHDVHNGPSVADAWFLYGKQADSAFCTTCHKK